MKTRELTPDLWPDLEKLFGPNGACAGCWCMFWRDGYNRTTNKRRFKALVLRGEAHGVLAYDGDEPVGWCSFERRPDLAKLNRAPSMKCNDADRVWSLPCFFIKSTRRGQGIATALLDAAIKILRKRGARIIEGYPYKVRKSAPGPFIWTGTLSMFTRAGFKIVGPKPSGKQRVRFVIQNRQT